MRDMLAYGQQSDDEAETTDFGDFELVLTRICRYFDEPYGPTVFSVHDYAAALDELSIAPHPQTYDTLKAIDDHRLMLSTTWVEALEFYDQAVSAEPAMESAVRQYASTVKRAFLLKLLRAAGQLSLQMADHYEQELLSQQRLLQSWNLRAQSLVDGLQAARHEQKRALVCHLRRDGDLAAKARRFRMACGVRTLVAAIDLQYQSEFLLQKQRVRNALTVLRPRWNCAILNQARKRRIIAHMRAVGQRLDGLPARSTEKIRPVDLGAMRQLAASLQLRQLECVRAKKHWILVNWLCLFKCKVLTSYFEVRQQRELLSLFMLLSTAKLYHSYNMSSEMRSVITSWRYKAAQLRASAAVGALVQIPTKRLVIGKLMAQSTLHQACLASARRLAAHNLRSHTVQALSAQTTKLEQIEARAQQLHNKALVRQTIQSIVRRRDEALERKSAAILRNSQLALIHKCLARMHEISQRMQPCNVVAAPLLYKMCQLAVTSSAAAERLSHKWARSAIAHTVLAGVDQSLVLEQQTQELLAARPHTMGAFLLREMAITAHRLHLRWSEVEANQTRASRQLWRRFFDQIHDAERARAPPGLRTPRSVQIPRSVRRLRPASSPAGSSLAGSPSTPRRVLFRSAGRDFVDT